MLGGLKLRGNPMMSLRKKKLEPRAHAQHMSEDVCVCICIHIYIYTWVSAQYVY